MIPTSQLTGTALVTEALEELQAHTAGDTLDTTDGAKALSGLNRLIDTTNVSRGNIVTERADTYTLAIGQQDYTIGQDPAGVLTPDFAAVRPVRITRANLLLSSSGDTPVYRKIDILTKEQWRRKSIRNVAGMPILMYSDEDFPLTTWSFYMVPDQAYEFEAWTWRQFSPLAALTDKIVIPPGYYDFWLYSLVMRLAGPFGKTPKATTVQLWKDAKEDVQLLNLRSTPMRTNGDLESGGGYYNWMSGLVEVD